MAASPLDSEHDRIAGAIVTDYLLAVGVVLGVNLLPAFGPPTWAVLVFFRLNWALSPVPLVLAGAIAAASGRLLLARGCRLMRARFSARRLRSLARAETALTGSRARTVAGLGLFALSPVPSAQLFVAAGVMTVPLVPLTAAFFAGRLVSYSIYMSATALAERSLGDLVSCSLTSPLGLAIQVLMLLLVVLLVRIDWSRIIEGPRAPGAQR